MAYNTVLQQGRFTSDGTDKTIAIRSDVDWMYVYNLTQALVQNDVGVQYYWQRGFETDLSDGGLRYFKSGGADTLNLLAESDLFVLVDSSGLPVGNAVATVSSTNAAQPVVSTGDTTGLVTGSIVRLASMAGAENIMSMDFEIDTVVTNTSFRMRWALANAPGGVGGAGTYRIIKFDPIYYPRRRFIVEVLTGNPTTIRTSVAHGFTVGQEIRFQIPSVFAMTQLNGLSGTITAVDTVNNTFSVNINSTAFTTFAFPTITTPFTYAQAIPFGEDTGIALANNVNILADATENLAILGMKLLGGADKPGGANTDVMYWVAGKSFSVNNE